MNKSKYEPTEFLGFYNAALAAYANTVLGVNALMLEYTIAATRTMLRATASAAPVAPAAESLPISATSQPIARAASPAASDPHAEIAQIEASLYGDDVQQDSREATVAEPAVETSTIELANETLEPSTSPRSNGPKKAGARRRRGKK